MLEQVYHTVGTVYNSGTRQSPFSAAGVSMTSAKTIIWLGVWLLILPFLGVPSAWKEGLVLLTGAVLLCSSLIRLSRAGGVSSLLRREAAPDTYEENKEILHRADKDTV
ncbi:MAG: hypothetical protein Greene041679_111 [Parcubacteria group bacterium Greene0416_79]|nr:MAG: hypothetical protein Greene041679_111 [Parcubacteria group bacterium Greene0416_79]